MSASDKAPVIPKVVDEAGDTPIWVPVAGLLFLGLLALMLVVAQSHGSDDAPPKPAAVEKAVVEKAADGE